MDNKNPSAVIDISSVEPIEFDDNFGTNYQKANDTVNTSKADYLSSVRKNIVTYAWNEGKQKAEAAFQSYANVDLLRPYFDVEPHQVLQRILVSFVPYRHSNDSLKVPSEFYGPIMNCFTLVAVLLLEMKISNHYVQEGTLMGSALITVFGYWLGASGLLWLVAFVCKTHLRPTQITSLIGYALSSHILVTFVNIVIHSNNSHLLFYITWAVLGGLTTSKMVAVIVARTPGHTERIILAGLIVILHMFFLIYLHFAYHKIVADLSEVLRQQPGDQLLHFKTLGKDNSFVKNTRPIEAPINDLNIKASSTIKALLPRRMGAPTRSTGLLQHLGGI